MSFQKQYYNPKPKLAQTKIGKTKMSTYVNQTCSQPEQRRAQKVQLVAIVPPLVAQHLQRSFPRGENLGRH
jgi:hypothetical protein